MAVKTITIDNEDRYKLYAMKLAYDKMRAYVELCEDEIGWHGLVEKLKDDKGYILTDVYLLKQEVNGATTEIDEDAELEYYMSMTREQQDKFIQVNKLWGHSHVNMSPGPSGQDDTEGKRLSKDVDDFFIRLITNKKNEYHITFYDKQRGLLVITDDITIYDPTINKLREQIQEEIKEKVKKKSYTSYNNNTSNNTNNSTLGSASRITTKKTKDIVVSKLHIKDIFNNPAYKAKLLFG